MFDGEELEMELDEDGEVIDPQSAEGIKRKHRRKKREAERKALEIEKNGEADLQTEFKHCFQLYSQRLLEKLPVSSSTVSGVLDSSSGGTASKVKLGDKQEEELCFVINTAEYCADTLPSLEEVIRAKIDKAFSESIELSDISHDMDAAVMKRIVAGLETSLDEELTALHKVNWQDWQAVGDESSYVTLGRKDARVRACVAPNAVNEVLYTRLR